MDNEFKMMVKLPDESDIEKMVKLQQDINESIKILSDENCTSRRHKKFRHKNDLYKSNS